MSDGYKPNAGGAATVAHHREFVLTMYGDRDVVHMRLRAVSTDAVIKLVEGRRVPTPPGMSAYVVSEIQ